jgi:hypothetical protein
LDCATSGSRFTLIVTHFNPVNEHVKGQRPWNNIPRIRYTQGVRRAVAALMAVLFSCMLITPALAAPTNTVHACCLRGGKHHCSTSGSASNGPALLNARCAQFQWQGAVVAGHHAGPAERRISFLPSEARSATLIAEQQTELSTTLRVSRPRGPPQA